MSDIELVKKYVKNVTCGHCKGSNKCNCRECGESQKEHIYKWCDPNVSYYEHIEGYRPGTLERVEAMNFRSKKMISDLKGTCAKCGGKGKKEIIDFALLRKEVESGEISSAMNEAIKSKLFQLVPSLFG